VEGAFRTTDFTVEWEHHRLRCPEGHMSASWGEYQGKRMIEFYSPTGPAFGRHSSNERGSLRLVRSHPT
jgi:hypothetical protein